MCLIIYSRSVVLLAHSSRAVCCLGIKILDLSRLFIPKRQTAGEECTCKTRDLEYIIKHKVFRCSWKADG